jgi:hypothetical protein
MDFKPTAEVARVSEVVEEKRDQPRTRLWRDVKNFCRPEGYAKASDRSG